MAGERPSSATLAGSEIGDPKDAATVTMSVPEPLGDFIARASLQSDLTILPRILIERIEQLSTRVNPAGDSASEIGSSQSSNR